MLQRNWLIGKRIAEEELKDSRKENYGLEIIASQIKEPVEEEMKAKTAEFQIKLIPEKWTVTHH